MPRAQHHEKSINLALQGGGSHGAFTWGVIDRLMEDDRLWVEAISGTSAGAMNAVVAAQGMYEDGAAGARRALRAFWQAISEAGRHNPIRRTALDLFTNNWSLDQSPGYIAFDLMSRLASPYDLNPLDINPLRDLVAEHIDFDKVRRCGEMSIFVSATNVQTGRVRVFSRKEMSIDVVMASACLPQMFKAVEIDGEPYWDGGFMGNPVLFPFHEQCQSADVLIVQINPVHREGTPKTAREILNRVNEITFNSSLLKELRAVDFVRRLIDDGHLSADDYRRMNVHIIHDRKQMRTMGVSSKLNTEWRFLTHLFDIGRRAADRWIDAHYDDIGVRSTVDVREMFSGEPGEAPPRPKPRRKKRASKRGKPS